MQNKTVTINYTSDPNSINLDPCCIQAYFVLLYLDLLHFAKISTVLVFFHELQVCGKLVMLDDSLHF